MHKKAYRGKIPIKEEIMKVFIVIEYKQKDCTIEGVYSSREGAEKKAERKRKLTKQDFREYISYHVLAKSVKGLSDISFTEQDGKRFIDVKRKPKGRK